MAVTDEDVETSRRETLRLLGTDDPEAVAHITKEALSREAKDLESCTDPSDEPVIAWGHRMAFGFYQGVQGYFFYADDPATTEANACGDTEWYFGAFNKWSHEVQSRTCNVSESDRVVKFTKK